jgi:hypothetical protein
MDNLRAGDYVIVRGESGLDNAGRLGIVRSLGTVLVTVEFKEGDIIAIHPDNLERMSLIVYITGDFVTLVDIDIQDDEGRVAASSGDPAIVLDHKPHEHQVRLGIMLSPDDQPFEVWIDDRNVTYRERWDR